MSNYYKCPSCGNIEEYVFELEDEYMQCGRCGHAMTEIPDEEICPKLVVIREQIKKLEEETGMVKTVDDYENEKKVLIQQIEEQNLTIGKLKNQLDAQVKRSDLWSKDFANEMNGRVKAENERTALKVQGFRPASVKNVLDLNELVGTKQVITEVKQYLCPHCGGEMGIVEDDPDNHDDPEDVQVHFQCEECYSEVNFMDYDAQRAFVSGIAPKGHHLVLRRADFVVECVKDGEDK